MPMQTSKLRIARDPALALAVRIFVGGVGERWGLAESVRDDLRLAASELFAGAVEAGGEDPVDLTFSSDDGSVTLQAQGHGSLVAGSSDGAPWGDRFSLIRTLFPQAEVGDAVTITVPVAEPTS